MRKIVVILFACIAGISCAFAQEGNEWMGDAPDKYLPHTTKMIVSRESPCNQGEEAFMDFIPKFRTNKVFRESRLLFNDEMQSNLFNMLAESNNGNGYALLKASQKSTRCDKSYGTWYSVSADEVCFKYEDVLPCSDWGGGACYARFQRINGKWYCTGFIAAG